MNVIENNDARRVVFGVEYHAVTARSGVCISPTDYCTLYSDPRREVGCKDLPCHKHLRNDRTDVIWVKAVP